MRYPLLTLVLCIFSACGQSSNDSANNCFTPVIAFNGQTGKFDVQVTIVDAAPTKSIHSAGATIPSGAVNMNVDERAGKVSVTFPAQHFEVTPALKADALDLTYSDSMAGQRMEVSCPGLDSLVADYLIAAGGDDCAAPPPVAMCPELQRAIEAKLLKPPTDRPNEIIAYRLLADAIYRGRCQSQGMRGSSGVRVFSKLLGDGLGTAAVAITYVPATSCPTAN